MAEFCITSVIQNEKGIITEIGLGEAFTRISIQTAIDDIINSVGDTYYIMKDGKRHQVFAKKQFGTGRWFLTTNQNDSRENSLASAVQTMVAT